ncbi:MAG: HAMP domain-containing histidine kinase [Chloroflexi bacterium]|nr:HAMP domain-containing histidine kinase [Chloroflexota bacterium]
MGHSSEGNHLAVLASPSRLPLIQLVRELAAPRAPNPDAAFRERTIRILMLVAFVYFTIIALAELIQGFRLPDLIWYGVIYGLIGLVCATLYAKRTALAARLCVLSVLLIVLDPTAAYWSPGTVVFSLLFTLLFYMILDHPRDVTIGLLINFGVFAFVTLQSNESPLPADDYFAQPASALLTMFGAQGIIIGIAHYIRRDQQQRNQTALLAEQQQVDVLRQFLYNASHDLRTPLAKIRLASYLAQQSQAEDQRAHLATLDGAVDRLEKMLLAMLDMSMLDCDPQLVPEDVDVRVLLDTLVSVYQPKAQHKHQHLTFQASSSDLLIRCDGRYIKRAISNVIDNALLFTPEHGMIHITAARKGQHIVITVQDNGVGIPPDKLPYIFDRFYRGDEARNSATGNNGLGLAIAKKIIDLHGGTILAESAVGVGSTFTITLPS